MQKLFLINYNWLEFPTKAAVKSAYANDEFA